MNTPEPCCDCEKLEWDVLFEDDPNDIASCLMGLTLGNPVCPYYGKRVSDSQVPDPE